MTAEKKTTTKSAADQNKQDKASEKVFAGYESLVDLSKGNLDAAMKSGAIFAQGLEELNTMVFAMARANMEDSLKAGKTLMACKSPEEFFERQNDLAKGAYEKTLDEQRKIADVSVKLAEKASAPLAERVGVNVDVISKSFAA